MQQEADATASALCDQMLIEAQGATNAVGGASAGFGGQLRLSGGPLGGHADNRAGNVVLGLYAYTWAQCQSMEGGVVIADAHAEPTAAPATGAALWSFGQVLKTTNPLAVNVAAGYLRLGLVAGSGAGSAASVGGLRMQGNGAVQGQIVFRNAGTAAADVNILHLVVYIDRASSAGNRKPFPEFPNPSEAHCDETDEPVRCSDRSVPRQQPEPGG